MRACPKCVRLAKLARAKGATLAALARVCGLGVSALSRRLSAKKETKKPRPKAKSKAIEARRKRVAACIRNDSTHAKVASEVRRKLKLDVCDRTIARDLKALAGRWLSMPRGPLVVEGGEPRRKAWCEQQLRDENYGVTSVFCDEKLFSLSQKGLKREWILPGMARRHRKVGHTMMVNMFCAVCAMFLKQIPSGKDLGPRHGKYEVPKPKKNPNEKRARKRKTFAQKKKKARKGMDSEAFIDIILKPLSAVLKRGKGRTLYLDNATVHRERVGGLGERCLEESNAENVD